MDHRVHREGRRVKAEPGPERRVRTLVDLYADRDLTDSQCRRIVAALGLWRERDTSSDGDPGGEAEPLPDAA